MIWFMHHLSGLELVRLTCPRSGGVLTMLNPWLLSKDASSVFWYKGISIFIQQAIWNCLYKCPREKGLLAILWPVGRKWASFDGFVSGWKWMGCGFSWAWIPPKMAENGHFEGLKWRLRRAFLARKMAARREKEVESRRVWSRLTCTE